MYSHDAAQMSRFFKGLDRTERYVLLLFYADGLTTTEIGLVLDLPETKVRTMLESLRGEAMRRLGRPAPVTRQATPALAKSA
tara:strand:+ start:22 stop:267 length:246 start_codon:yes stop_codon:yes gene_type:complete